MAVTAIGPSYAGGALPLVKDGYSALVLPEVENSRLQQSGQPAVFYVVPNAVRFARTGGPDTGDFLFSMLRFAGVDPGGGAAPVSGGLLTFSVTGALPEAVHRQILDELALRYGGSGDPFWGIRNGLPPVIRPAVVMSTTTTVSNVSPTPSGIPTLRRPGGAGATDREFHRTGFPYSDRDEARARTGAGGRERTEARSDNLDAWYWAMEGEGTGSIDPTGTHAYSALVGNIPATLLWQGFHGTASPLVVIQNYKLKVWSPVVTLSIKGEWDKIFEHFSAAASGRYLWASVDIKAQIQSMRTNGTITVSLKVDSTLPGADVIAQRLEQQGDLVFDKFMAAAQNTIFTPPPQEPAATASSGNAAISPWGVGFALDYRRDTTNLTLEYYREEQIAYLQDHTFSSSLGGLFDELKRDPDAEKKYFSTVYLDWPTNIAKVCRPVVSWDDGAVEFVAVQLGYPNSEDGSIAWEGHSFAKDDAVKGVWSYQTIEKAATDVPNPPPDWKPDLTYLKRSVHLAEPPNPLLDPYNRIQIEKNVIEIDDGPYGNLTNDVNIEVRADSAGRLAVGPIDLNVVLTDESQIIEVVFEALDAHGSSAGWEAVRFRWMHSDHARDRKWFVFTGDPGFRPFYRYKVFVTVKGTIFEPGRAWEGPWQQANGNGPLLVTVPRPTDAGVVPHDVDRSAGRDDGRPALRLTPDGAASASPSGAPR